jgi:lysophospholipase L1-like esterase
VDVAAAFPADAQNYDDCIHPSEAGHEIIAGILAEALRSR